MQTISYRGDGLDCEVVVRRPTVYDSVLHRVVTDRLDEGFADGDLLGALVGEAVLFALDVTCVAESKGLPFTIPGLDATKQSILKAFGEWLLLPKEDFVDKWNQAAVDARRPILPKARRSETPAPARSKSQRGRSQQRDKGS